MAGIIKKILLTILAIVVCGTMAFLLLSCDSGLHITQVEIKGLPNRIIYVANVDTEIDLSGLTMVITTKQGDVEEESLAGVTDSLTTGLQVNHAIDFTKPGVYEINLYYGWREKGLIGSSEITKVSYTFLIQVIDDEIYAGLKEHVIQIE